MWDSTLRTAHNILFRIGRRCAPYHKKYFSGEVVRCGASQKKPLRDSTQSTALSGLIFWDVPQIAAYREKSEWVAYRKVQRRIIPIKSIYPTLAIGTVGVMNLHTEIKAEDDVG